MRTRPILLNDRRCLCAEDHRGENCCGGETRPWRSPAVVFPTSTENTDRTSLPRTLEEVRRCTELLALGQRRRRSQQSSVPYSHRSSLCSLLAFVSVSSSLPLFIYLFKINGRRTRGSLILSDVHKNTKLAQYDKLQKRKQTNKQTNKQTDDIYRVGQKSGPFLKVRKSCVWWRIGSRSIYQNVHSLSEVRVIFWMWPYLNILCIDSQKRHYTENTN